MISKSYKIIRCSYPDVSKNIEVQLCTFDRGYRRPWDIGETLVESKSHGEDNRPMSQSGARDGYSQRTNIIRGVPQADYV